MTTIEARRERARELGIETSYFDVEGRYHEASEATLQAIIDVLEADAASSLGTVAPVVVGRPTHVLVGASPDAELVLTDTTVHPLVVEDGHVALPPDLPVGCHRIALVDGTVTLVVPPPQMPRARALAGGAAVFVPAYALWEESAPLPSFTHLGAFGAAAHDLGVAVVSTLPLYAAFLDDPFDPSPYAPVSRLHWNEVYLDDVGLPAAPVPEQDTSIDWRQLAARRRRQLLDQARDLDPVVAADIDRFVTRRPDVAGFARFGSIHPRSADHGSSRALIERSHLLAQYLADGQIAAVEGDGRAALALDLPIGSHPAGYETWAHPDLFATGMTVGAPPDEFFDGGQDWGFPPQLPFAGRRDGHSLWRRLVGHAGERASVLRIDHVMGVHRLWWVPDGMGATDGAYVRYPRDELLAVIAAEAARTSTTIIGENLGTVPDEVTSALEHWDVVGMYEEQFTMYEAASIARSSAASRSRPLPEIPTRSVAGIRTHDMAAFAAAYEDHLSDDLDDYRRALAAAVRHPVGDGADDVLDAAIERLAASDAYLVIADVDDLVGETAPHNVPGQALESTWRRRLARPASAVVGDPDVRRRIDLLASRAAGGIA